MDPSPADVVCAVTLSGASGEAALQMDQAVDRQTRQPDRQLAVAAGRRDGYEELRLGLPEETDWLWLLDGSALPEPTALERLLDTLGEAGLPRPALMASKVIRADGSLDPAALPVAQVIDPDLAVDVFERRLLSLRVARGGSLLVQRSALDAVGSRRPRLSPFHDDLEWTARVLRDRLGLLVPGSVAVRGAGASGPPPRAAHQEVASRIRLLLGDALDRRDKPWFAFRFVEEGLAHIRGAGR